MKPATGNNRNPAATEVSIQLALDGHSFSVVGLSEGAAGSAETDGATGTDGAPALSVEVLTPRTLLVPAELFAPESAAALLAAGGVPAHAGDTIVWSDPQAEAVAVMAAGSEAVERVRAYGGAATVFTCPLLPVETPQVPTVRIRRAAGLLYIKVYAPELRMAEVLPAASEADLCVLLERLEGIFPLKEYRLQLVGERDKRLRKALKNHFKEVVCES